MPFNMEMPLLIFSRLKEDPLLLGEWAPVRGPEEQKKLKELFDKQPEEPIIHHGGMSMFRGGKFHVCLTGSPMGLVVYSFWFEDDKLFFVFSLDGQVVDKFIRL